MREYVLTRRKTRNAELDSVTMATRTLFLWSKCPLTAAFSCRWAKSMACDLLMSERK